MLQYSMIQMDYDLPTMQKLLESGLADKHHKVKNAVQGSLKRLVAKNPAEIIPFCKKYITSADPEIRRSVAHGLELRGRTHPEDVMPALRLLQFEKHKRVRPMLIHIFGQISYKPGCLEKVTAELLTWKDKQLAGECFEEIIRQHGHYHATLQTIKVRSAEECKAVIEDMKKQSL